MSLELLRDIERAEAQAEDARQRVQREAREIIKGVEEACVARERAAALEHRALAQRILQDARATANKRIASMAEEDAAARVGVCERAKLRVGEAAEHIFEKVVKHGNR